MNWFYVDAGQQRGPISETDLENLFATGVIRPETLIWHEGMPDWQPYSRVKPAAAVLPEGSASAPSGLSVGGVVCSECRGTFPADQVVKYGNSYVCASCKPVFLQKLREGTAVGGGGGGRVASMEEILARDYSLSASSCLSRAWTLVIQNPLVTIVGSLIFYVILMACSFVPFIGGFIQLALQGPLTGGLYHAILRLKRGENVGVGDIFSGFGPKFLPYMLVHIVSALIMFACFIPAIIAFVIPFAMSGGKADPEAIKAYLPFFGVAGVLALICFAAVIYFTICWLFSLLLVADRDMDFWGALRFSRNVVKKHWWQVFWLVILGSLICIAGVLALCVGLLVALPVFFAMVVFAYEDIFGERATVRQ